MAIKTTEHRHPAGASQDLGNASVSTNAVTAAVGSLAAKLAAAKPETIAAVSAHIAQELQKSHSTPS